MKGKLLIVLLLLGVISISFTGCLSMIFPELNNPPVLAPIPNTTIALGETFSYTVEAADPDEGDTLIYSLITDPSTNMAINPTTGVINWTPTATGSFEVTVEVSDGKSSDTESFTVTVSLALVGPSNVDLTPLTATVGVEYTGTVTATPGDNTTLTFSLVGAPGDMTIVPTTGAVTWTPITAGNQTVTVVVTDGAAESGSKSFIIVVSTANQAPVIAPIPDASVIAGETFTYPVDATDPDGDDLTYSLTTTPSTNMAINENSGVISWTPTAVGSFEVTVEVFDGKSSDTESFTVTVSPAPIGPSNVDLTPLTATVGVDYTGIATATPGDNTTLTFSLVGAPSGMEISTAGVITWTPTVTGDQTVTVVVTDGAGLSDSKSFIIVVSTVNKVPVLASISDATVTAGEIFTYSVDATDPDGDDLTYSLTTTPTTNMAINSTTGVISWTPAAIGNFKVTVEVSDGELSDTQSFNINVIVPNRVVMAELFVAPACGRCPSAKASLAQLLEKYGFDKLVVLEEYVANSPLPYSSGWSTPEISQRYFNGYYEYLNSDERGTPDAYFNGLNQSVHQEDTSYANYEAAIEAELAKTPKVVISASYDIAGSTVSVSGQISNISSETLKNIVIEAMVYEDDVPLVIPDYNINTIVNHVVRDIITYQESGETITSFSPGNSYQFSLDSSSLSNVRNMNNIHVVVYVQAPNSPTMEILQALYVN